MAVTYYFTAQLQLEINGVYINVDTPSTTASKDIPGLYLIRAYKNDNGTITQLDDSSGLGNIKVSVTRNVDTVSWVDNAPHVQTVHYVESNINKTKFLAKFKNAAVPASFKPRIDVTREASPGSSSNVPVDFAPTSGQSANGVTAIQTVNYTQAANTIPPMPSTVIAAVGGDKYTSQAKWDASLSQWVVAITKKVTGSASAYNVSVQYYDESGALKKTQPLGTDNKSKGPAYKTAQSQLLTAIKNTYTTTQQGTSNPSVPSGSNAKGITGTFNPPNHIYTRRPSFSDIMDGIVSPKADITSIEGVVSGNYALGRMVQDKNSAKLLNTKIGKNPAPKDVFGFRFSYNPTTISYATSANAPIDWTLGSSDSANILGGPTMVSFDLYLNRIADVAELSTGKYQDSHYPGKGLSTTDQLGLKTRGTEYDLEFLYRMVNGTPVPTDLTLSNQVTSDFGYITGVPFWLFFNDSLRYYGGLSALNVNHVMFSKSMVPIFTVVSVTFNRYPVFDKTGYVGKKAAQQYQDTGAGKTTTTTTP